MENSLTPKKIYEGNLVEIYRINDHIYHRKANLEKRDQCDGAFIVGDAEVAVVDAPPEGIEMVEEAEKLFGKPVSAVFLTHGHGDHINGLKDFLERDKAGGFPKGLTVYCSNFLLENMKSLIRENRTTFVGVENNLKLSFSGGIDIELFVLGGTAHSLWDMIIRTQDPDIICTGDVVVEYETAYFHSADIHGWINGLKKLEGMKGNWILAGHGPRLFPYSYLEKFRDFLGTIERAALECIDRYKPYEKQIPAKPYDDISPEKFNHLVSDYFMEQGHDAKILEELAGKKDAQREVQMVAWSLLRGSL